MNYAMSTEGSVSRKYLSEYIGFYLGQQVLTPSRKSSTEGKKMGYKNGELCEYSIKSKLCEVKFDEDSLPIDFDVDEIKLLLIPLKDMNDDDMKFIEIEDREFMLKNFEIGNVLNFTAEQFRYLLNRGFDLFGLIEAGLAIDKTKLEDERKATP